MSRHDVYQSPLVGRYTSKEQQVNWSDDKKYGTWRRMWHAIAAVQYNLGVPIISQQQLDEMALHFDDINYERVAEIERIITHDVVSHKNAYGEVAPSAATIMHYGCTSCDITDNSELVQIRDGLLIIKKKIGRLLRNMQPFIEKYADLPTLGHTHLKNAQPTTVGKRAAMWAQDFVWDLQAVHELIEWLPFRGLKDATGTQASFLEIFQGDEKKVELLEKIVAKQFGFKRVLRITGQTYSRKIDTRVIAVLSSFAASVHKMAQDVRFLQMMGELVEPFNEEKISSSAMPYKDNPMKDERACSLARELFSPTISALSTQALQAFERTLDDSAGRRRYLAESFLLADAIALIMINVTQGWVVYPKVIEHNLRQELPYLAAAPIMGRLIALGADRNECHEKLRQHTKAAALRLRTEGGNLDLIDRLKADEFFTPVVGELDGMLDPQKFVGLAPQQATAYAAQIGGVLAEICPEVDTGEVALKV